METSEETSRNMAHTGDAAPAGLPVQTQAGFADSLPRLP